MEVVELSHRWWWLGSGNNGDIAAVITLPMVYIGEESMAVMGC